MRKYVNIIVYSALLFLVITCKKNESQKQNDTMLEGKATVLVDETLKPIVEDQIQVFESNYEAKLSLEAKSETEVMQALSADNKKIAILSRELNQQETDYFQKKKIFPKITLFAKDGIALIINQNTKDTLITLQELTDLMKGKPTAQFKGLVFDNPNSSTAHYFCTLAGVKNLPEQGVFSFKTNAEVIQYVAQNNGMIGVIGINHIFEPTGEMKDNMEKINVLHVMNQDDNQYYYPSQNSIAEGKYPLARDLFVVNCQGYAGLGMGFASFVTSDIGQRIVLKSGLVPVKFPPRKVRIRNTINKQ